MKIQAERVLVNQEDFMTVARLLKREATYFISGSSSIYVPSQKRKYINRNDARPWLDLDGELQYMTPGEAARTELKREYPDLKRVGWRRSHIKLFDERAPLHFEGSTQGPMIYIDLDAAYWQIYRSLWLDTPYPLGFYGKYPLADVADRLKHWKRARNSLVGVCAGRKCTAFKGFKMVTLFVANPFLSPLLWASVQRVLQDVGGLALRYGAKYINTDGYVFEDTTSSEWPQFVIRLSQNGFQWSIRAQGLGEIAGWNKYQIGSYQTKSFKLGIRTKQGAFSNVRQYTGRWIEYKRRCADYVEHKRNN